MAVIELYKDDPIVKRAMALHAAAFTEVGFIPGDEYGCKFYASNMEGKLRIIGVHSRIYGCHREPYEIGVVVVDRKPR